jgi:hypothetical protein
MLTPARLARVATATFGVVYAVALYFAGIKLGQGLKQAIAYLPTIAGFGVLAFDKWLWKLPPVHLFVPRPLVGGLWRATLLAVPDGDPSGQARPGLVEAYVVIVQSFWSISIRQYTAESRSDCRTAAFSQRGNAQQHTLSYIYENHPRPEHLGHSPRHVGACEIEIVGRAPTELTGFYFTDRRTRGEMTLRLCDRTTDHATFTAARQHCAYRSAPAPTGAASPG